MSRRPKMTHSQRSRQYFWRRAARVLIAAVAIATVVIADRAGLFDRATTVVEPLPITADRQRYDGQSFRCTRVIDGDTFDLDVPDRPHATTRVRLWGVDTPELAHDDAPADHFGPEASAYTRSLVEGQTVTLELEPGGNTRGRHGRLLAFVILPDGRMLNRLLVETGHAYADPRYQHHLYAEFRASQTAARNARLGLWKSVQPTDLPYYWQGVIEIEP